MDIDLLEAYALAQDRKAVLGRFVPGTREHFIACWLLSEHTGYPQDLKKPLDDFCQNNGEHNDLVKAYQARRKLVQYDASAKATSEKNKEAVDWIVQNFGLQLNHGRPADAPAASASAAETPSGEKLPSALSESALESLSERALIKALADRDPDNFARELNAQNFAYDRPELIKLLQSRASAWLGDGSSFFNLLNACVQSGGGAVPSLDGAEGGDATMADWVLKAVNSAYAVSKNQGQGLLDRVLDSSSLSLLLLLGSKGSSAVTASTSYVCAILRRLAPVLGADFKADKRALDSYLSSVQAYLDTLPSSSFRGARECILYHRLKALQGNPRTEAGAPPAAASAEAVALLEALLVLGPRARSPYNDAPVTSGETGRATLDRLGGWFEPGRDGPILGSLSVPNPQAHEVDALIRACLLDLLSTGVGAPGTALSPWKNYLNEAWLKGVQAEARLTRGSAADVEECQAWAKNLEGGSGALQGLTDRVVLEFGPGNPEYLHWTPSPSPVTLSLQCKAVPRVTVSLYEVNTQSYYTAHGKEVPSDIALDGLMPSMSYAWDLTGTVGTPAPTLLSPAASSVPAGGSGVTAGGNLPGQPLRLHQLQVSLSSLGAPGADRGLWVVEVVGGGRSCRAILRRGALRYLERRTVAGHVLTVVGEDNVPLPRGRVSVYLAGRRYTPEPGPDQWEAGGDTTVTASHEILIPYGPARSNVQIVLCLDGEASSSSPDAWSFATLAPFTHYEESYSLACAWVLERESLVRDNYSATVIVRPRLKLHGDTTAPLAALTNITLTVCATDATGSVSQRVEKNLSLSGDKELAQTFAVPANARSLTFTLQGDVELCSGHVGGKQVLSASHAVEMNEIDRTDDTRDVHLRLTQSSGYVLSCLGKTGEPCAGVTMHVSLKSSLFNGSAQDKLPALKTQLMSDSDGRVVLGHLPKHVTRILVRGAWGSGGSDRSANFDLPSDCVAYPTTVHTVTSVPASQFTGAGGKQSILAGLLSTATPAADGKPAPGAAVVARFPFRPDCTNPSTYVLSRKDFHIVEVRPRPLGPNSAAWQGAIGNGLGGPTITVSDAFKYSRFDPDSSMIVLAGLPAGVFEARVKRPFPGADSPGPVVTLRALPAGSAVSVAGQIASGNIQLQARPGITTAAAASAASPVQVTSVTADYEQGRLLVNVAGGMGSGGGGAEARDVRVHLLVTHFLPLWDAGLGLCKLDIPGLSCSQSGAPGSRYLNGRTLGEEQRYVLERQEKVRAGAVLPGNLLPRPQLLLNPVSLGPVGMDTQEAQAGEAYGAHADGAAQAMHMAREARFLGRAGGSSDAVAHASYVTLDFLRRPALVLSNLRVERSADRTSHAVAVPLAALIGLTGPGTEEVLGRAGEVFVTVVAADGLHTSATTASIALTRQNAAAARAGAIVHADEYRDLASNKSALDPDEHVLQRSRTAVLSGLGSTVRVAAAAAWTKAEVYGSLDRAAGLLASLAGGAPSGMLVRDFGWLLGWPRLSAVERSGRYSKWACHEVHVWLWWKDGAYFDSVVAPYLAGKRSMTLIDHFLLGSSLALKAKAGGMPPSAAHACTQRAAAHWRAVRAFSSPAAFTRLNAFEQALVAAALSPADASAVARCLSDALELHAVDTETTARVFKAALASNALSGEADEGMADLLAEADRAAESSRKDRRRAAPAPPPAPMMQQNRNGAPMMAKQAMRKMAAAPMARSMAMQSAPSAMPGMAVCGGGAAPVAAMAMMAMPMAIADEAMPASLADYACDSSEYQDESDLAMRSSARSKAGYVPLDKTEEYAEAGYHGVHREEGQASTVGLVSHSPLWADLAAHMARIVGDAHATCASDGSDDSDTSIAAVAAEVAQALRSKPFVSAHFALSAAVPVAGPAPFGCLTALLLTLAVTGLPVERETLASACMERPRIGLNEDRSQLVYTAGRTPSVLFYQDISPVPSVSSSSAVLVGQAYVDPRDAQHTVKGQWVDKFLPTAEDGSVEVVAGRVYACRVVVSNISSVTQQLSVLLHIPSGALPCNDGVVLDTKNVTLGPYTTTTLSYPFYLPRPGTVRHFPVHVYAEGESGDPELVAYASPVTLRTVNRATVRDTASWAYVAANGSEADILAFMGRANLSQSAKGGPPPCPLEPLLWRCSSSPSLWLSCSSTLRARRIWHEGMAALAFKHGDLDGMREYMATEAAVGQLRRGNWLGPFPCLSSPLLVLGSEEGAGTSAAGPTVHKAMGGAYPAPVHYSRGGPVHGIARGAGGAGGEGFAYEHLEYSPLVNARAHQLGNKRKILNSAVARQWRRLLTALSSKPASGPGCVSSSDLLAASYLLLLQDRVDEAVALFKRVEAPEGSVAAAVAAGRAVPAPAFASGIIAGGAVRGGATDPVSTATAVPQPWPALQYDYTAAFLDFYGAGPVGGDGAYALPVAAAVARAYGRHPVAKWAARFKELAEQLEEAGVLVHSADRRAEGVVGADRSGQPLPVGLEAGVLKEVGREAGASASLASEPSIELSNEGTGLLITYANLSTNGATLRIFAMDLEILFSTSPFTAAAAAGNGGAKAGAGGDGGMGKGGMFSYVRPNLVERVLLPSAAPGRQGEVRVSLPPAYARSNVMVEVAAAGLRRTLPYYATSMSVAVSEPFGRLRVTNGATGLPLPRVYIKVYATSDGEGGSGASSFFYKDCYTDARGVADYTSLSTDELSRARKFAILVSSPTHGSLVRTAAPPLAGQ